MIRNNKRDFLFYKNYNRKKIEVKVFILYLIMILFNQINSKQMIYFVHYFKEK